MPRRRRQEGTALIPSNLHVAEDCRAVSEVLARVGDKWSVLVVATLGDGPKRFNELRRAIASISQRMLTLTLRGLERDGAGHANHVPDHTSARRLRADRARLFPPYACQCARRLGAPEQAKDPAGQSKVRCCGRAARERSRRERRCSSARLNWPQPWLRSPHEVRFIPAHGSSPVP